MRKLRELFSRQRAYSDLAEEMQQHLEEKIEELVAAGVPRQEAVAAARREFGNEVLIEERAREVWQWRLLDGLLRDLRITSRQLRRHPGFTVTVIITLTLAIGANTAVFSMVSALLLRPLPYPHPERLAALNRHVSGVTPSGNVVDQSDDGQDGETWELIRDNVPAALSAAYSFDSSGINLEANRQARYVQDHRVSAAFFDVLGIRPLLGRTFSAEEDRPHGPNAVILSFELWQSAFAGDRTILGQTIRLKGDPYTVVGVMPAGVRTTSLADLWTPIQPWRGGEGGGDNYEIVMRLRDGVSWAQLNSQLRPLHPSLFDHFFQGARSELVAKPLQPDLAEEKRNPTLILMLAAGSILLIATANLAGLLLVRLSRRSGEITTRLALGAPRAAILRQVLMEPLLLTLGGTACGVALAFFGLRSFANVFPPGMLPLGGISIDLRVLTFALLCALGTATLIGIFPAAAARRQYQRPWLSNRNSGDDRYHGRTRQILIAGEVCLSLVLLAGTGLLIRSLVYLQSIPPGFDASNVLTAKASLDDSRYHDPVAFQKLLRDSLAGMRQIPGVEEAAVGLSLPYERGLNDGFKVLDGPKSGTETSSSSTAYVTPEYFHALRIPILSGRSFDDGDTSTSEPVVLVNASFARKHLGTLNVVGLHIALGKTRCTVVGLAGDVKKRPGIDANAPLSAEPMYYMPFTQVDEPYLKLVHVWYSPSWIVRSGKPIDGLAGSMQKALAETAPSLPFSGFYSMADLQALALSQQRVEVLLLSALSGLALLISLVGVYGLVANVVAQRRREIAIRMALGSTLGRAMKGAAMPGIIAVSLGIGTGLILAVLALGVLKSELYGVRSLDPATLVVACLALFAAALLASFAPTRRIALIDPAASLRTE
jgi:predicted permease